MSRIAFLDVDTQVDFMVRGGGLYAEGAEAINDNLWRLVRHAELRRIPLIATVDAHAPDDPEFKSWPPHCVRGTPGQRKIPQTTVSDAVIVPNEPANDLPDPRRTHIVLEKQDFPVFTNRLAERVFAATEAETFVVFGVVTEVCVKHAVMGLLQRGYKVQLVQDAIWPIAEATGRVALKEMVSAGAELVSTDQVLGKDD